jgi:thiol-disulfide isomerase/thioredoxin
MKNIRLLAILLMITKITTAQVKFDALSFIPQMPKARQMVSFKYDSKLSPLISEKKVEILVYLFSGNSYKIIEPAFTKKGSVYSGSFNSDTATSCIAFGFSANDDQIKDNNSGNGYIVPVYNNNNQPVTEYYLWAGRVYGGYGERLFGMKTMTDKNLALLEEGLKLNPEAKNNMSYFSAYLQAVFTAKKKDGEELAILGLLKNLADKPGIKEADYATLNQWYGRLKMKKTADSFTTIMKEKFPDGNWKKNELGSAFSKEKDLTKKLALYNEYIAKYPPTESNKDLIDNYKSQMANAYAVAKDFNAYDEWCKGLPKSTVARNNIMISMELSKKDELLEEAKKMSGAAALYAKSQVLNPDQKKPDNTTKKEWDKQRKSLYSIYANIYASIQYKTGDYKNGYQYAKESVTINEFKNAEFNENYALLLVKVTSEAAAKKEIEKLVKEGVASSKTKELLKELYVAKYKSDKGFDDYLAKLEMSATEKKREELAKTMINEEAPKFNLKDLAGNDVSLAGLNGKVVVVDFWATWCGPCIASMPAMKKAQEKLTSKGDVAFLFIDTWETVENKKQNAEDFMKKNNYPFHVLMDDNDKVVADFNVRGIPTKFVIDKTGNIRFKSVGFGGGDDKLVDEVSMMVEMAAADMPVRKYVK